MIITMFVPDTRFGLVQLVLRKYPQLKERNRPDEHRFKNRLPYLVLIPNTEVLMLSYPDNYDMLDYANIDLLDSKDDLSFLNYGEARKMLAEMGGLQK